MDLAAWFTIIQYFFMWVMPPLTQGYSSITRFERFQGGPQQKPAQKLQAVSVYMEAVSPYAAVFLSTVHLGNFKYYPTGL